MKHISRREFSALLAAGVVTGRFTSPVAFAQAAPAVVTANEVIDRIRRNVGVEWAAETVDSVKAGDPTTVVTGVVTTALATLDVLRGAVAAGANLVITSGPTFYGLADSPAPRTGQGPGGQSPPAAADPRPPDPVYAAKNEIIDTNGLVVFRLSDHWRRRVPDPFVQGLANTIGLEGAGAAGDVPLFRAAGATLEAFAGDLKRKLGSRGGIRVIGDRQSTVRRVALLPGTHPITSTLAALPPADVVIAGEIREWESSEYARDLVFSGQPKGLVLVGRVVSEEPGMGVCASWLETIVPEVPIRHITAGDPYWSPGS